MTLTLVPYSTCAGGIVLNGDPISTTTGTSLDWETTWAAAKQGLNYPSVDLQMTVGFSMWENACNIKFIKVPDSGAAFPASPAVETGPVVRFVIASMPADVVIAATTVATPGTTFGCISCYNSDVYPGSTQTYLELDLSGESMPTLFAHEMGHGVMGRVDNSDTTSIMCSTAAQIPVNSLNAADISNAVASYGATTTLAQKVGAGLPLGEIYSAYWGANNANPDNAGLVFWYGGIVAGGTTLSALTDALVGTATTDATFTGNCYSRMLGRSATSAEITYWSTSTKSAVLWGVAVSSEAGTYRTSHLSGGLWFS